MVAFSTLAALSTSTDTCFDSTADTGNSAFAARFLAQAGQLPLAYLRHWRMVLAQARLRSGHLSIAAVAEQVGYASHSAFASAYRRSFGHPPGRNRRETL